jgi:hypothetical protein
MLQTSPNLLEVLMEKSADLLNSWKEIAAYVGCGVRTAQRWESELGMPVRRPRERVRSAVLGLKSEIDQWTHSRGDSQRLARIHAVGLSEAISKLEQALRETLGESACNAEVDLLVKFAGRPLKDSTLQPQLSVLRASSAA